MLTVDGFSGSNTEKIRQLYYHLLAKHGSPLQSNQWAFWCKRHKTLADKERIIIESILTQRANWRNVEIAVSRLQQSGLMSLEGILKASCKEIEILIKPSGFYTQKAKRLRNIAKFFAGIGGIKNAEKIETSILRKKLLSLDGIGNETADDILLYAFERPVFVIDHYTMEFVKKYRLAGKLTYERAQNLFEKSIEKDYKLYQDYHALIVIEMKGKK